MNRIDANKQNNMFPCARVERRVTLQLLGYWERIRGVRQMPSESDINPDELSDLWDDCFLIHTSDILQDDYNFLYLGEGIKHAFIGEASKNYHSHEHLNVKRLTPTIEKVVRTRAPVIEEGEALNDLNQLIRYRQCLLPIGEGNKVLAVLGGMRCKVYPYEHTIQ